MDDPVVAAIGQNAVETGLLGAGVGGRQVVLSPGRDQPIGGEDRSLQGFSLAPFQLEAAGRNPGLKEDRSSLHRCDG